MRLVRRDGFSMLEMMAVVAIMAVVMISFLALFGNQNDAVSFVEDRLSRVSLNSEISSVLMNTAKCTDMLAGTNVPLAGNSATQVKDLAGTVLFNPATPPGKFEKLNIDNAYVTNVSVPGPLSTGVVTVTIELTRQRTGVGSAYLVPIKKNVNVEVDGAQNIITCFGLPYY